MKEDKIKEHLREEFPELFNALDAITTANEELDKLYDKLVSKLTPEQKAKLL